MNREFIENRTVCRDLGEAIETHFVTGNVLTLANYNGDQESASFGSFNRMMEMTINQPDNIPTGIDPDKGAFSAGDKQVAVLQ